MKLNTRHQYTIFAGIGIMTIILLLLFTSPSSFFSPMVTVIGGDPNKSSTKEVAVTTKDDFIDPEKMKNFPYDIGQWHGSDYDTGNLAETLKAKTVMMRGYYHEGFTQPMFLVVVQGNSDSAIHEPHYCYANIQEQVKEEMVVANPSWTQGASSVTVPLNLLVSAPQNLDGTLKERRLVLYFYIKGNPLYSDMVTLVEVQALAPLHGPYIDTLNEEKAFLAEVIPQMFEPSGNSSPGNPLITTLAEKGTGGYITIAIMLLVPLSMIIYPLMRRRG